MLTVGKLVVCLIYVISNNVMSQTEATGVVKSSQITSKMAIVDFSKLAKKEGWDGDYSNKLVEAEKCVEVN